MNKILLTLLIGLLLHVPPVHAQTPMRPPEHPGRIDSKEVRQRKEKLAELGQMPVDKLRQMLTEAETNFIVAQARLNEACAAYSEIEGKYRQAVGSAKDALAIQYDNAKVVRDNAGADIIYGRLIQDKMDIEQAYLSAVKRKTNTTNEVSKVIGTETTQQNTVTAPPPKAGTREFYEKNIKGRYYFQDDKMLSMPTTPETTTVKGIIAKVLDGMVVLENDVTMPSGAIRKQPVAIVLVESTNNLVTGDTFSGSDMVLKGSYACETALGKSVMVHGFKKIESVKLSGITFEQYEKVFRADSQPDTIVKAGATGWALREEARARHLEQYQMELIRAKGKKGPIMPMELTPEMENQLVAEGVLPPPNDAKPVNKGE